MLEPPNTIPSMIENLMEAQRTHIWALAAGQSNDRLHTNVQEAKRVLLAEVDRMFKMPDAQRRAIFLFQRTMNPGYFNRSDLCDTFDISIPQASTDIFKFMNDFPGKIEYNTSSKRYERRDNAEG